MDFCFCGSATRSRTATGAAVHGQIGGSHCAHLLGLGALDAHQRGVAQLVAAGLDGEHGGSGQLDGLEPAFFEFALHGEAGVGLLHVEDERGVGQAEQFGKDDAGLALAEVVGLQAGEDEVGALRLDGGGQQAGHAERVARAEVGAVDVDGAVRALGQGFADGGADALRSGGEDDDFAAVLLLELQGFFEGVGVGLVQRVLQAGFFNPLAGGVDADLRIALRDLLDGDDDFHTFDLLFILAGHPEP